MGTFRRSFGKRLQYLRKSRGLTQEQLAEKADLSWSQINAIEGGRAAPSFESLERISRALGVHPKDHFEFPVARLAQDRPDPLPSVYELLQRLPNRQLQLVLGIVRKALALARRS